MRRAVEHEPLRRREVGGRDIHRPRDTGEPGLQGLLDSGIDPLLKEDLVVERTDHRLPINQRHTHWRHSLTSSSLRWRLLQNARNRSINRRLLKPKRRIRPNLKFPLWILPGRRDDISRCRLGRPFR